MNLQLFQLQYAEQSSDEDLQRTKRKPTLVSNISGSDGRGASSCSSCHHASFHRGAESHRGDFAVWLSEDDDVRWLGNCSAVGLDDSLSAYDRREDNWGSDDITLSIGRGDGFGDWD